ncbi:MAG TPA: hypothetical protein VG474_12125, partial [Solirubrobacteraceae bacterium]|nr:hypothetical protein [Solirubrobacteraceae bacterium]
MQPDDLYGLPLERFIEERTALARALRADKRRDEARAVAALRKPSVAAWAVNQLVRTQGAAVAELFEAGDALREAQAHLLGGRGDGRALRAAGERERQAVRTLVEAARGLLSSDGHELSAAVIERVADTLHAAALDESAREQVRPGRLERELQHVGLGLGESPFAAQPPAPPEREAAPRAGRERAVREAREQAAAAERERAAARKAARSAEAAARRREERTAHALRAAHERRERAARALEQADAALAAARAEAEAAAEEHRRARAALDRL